MSGSLPKKRGRPKGSRNSSRSTTPMRSVHSYNLRQRKNDDSFDNSILDNESPDSFGKLVANIARETKVMIKFLSGKM